MPPRKSNVSTTSNGAENGAEAPPQKAAKEKDGMSVEVSPPNSTSKASDMADPSQDLSLPKSMVARLAKGVLPANTSIQKDALLALHKSATVFVNYIASTYVRSHFRGSDPSPTISPLLSCSLLT